MLFIACVLVVASGLVSKDELDAFYTPTPKGYILSNCIHSVPSGTHLVRTEGGALVAHHDDFAHGIRVIPKCVAPKRGLPTHVSQFGALPADYDGWLAYTAFNYSAGFDSFLGNFTVPNIPSGTPQVLYLFTGLQNIDWIPKVDPESQGQDFDIIQPVLQFPGDDGRYWSVKSWFVTLDEGAVASDEEKTTPGDYIFGNMTQTGRQTWFIGSTVGSTGKTTFLTQTNPRLAGQFWAYNVLEAYGDSGCSDEPTNTCVFTGLSLTSKGEPVPERAIDWKVNPKPNPDPKCHETIVVVSNSEQVISFQKK